MNYTKGPAFGNVFYFFLLFDFSHIFVLHFIAHSPSLFIGSHTEEKYILPKYSTP